MTGHTHTAASLIELRDLHIEFRSQKKRIQAVNGVSMHVARGEVLALIGESGSGKSVTLRALMRLHDERRTRYTGTIRIAGQDLLATPAGKLQQIRGKRIAMVFQEPLLALDPVYTVGAQIIETIRHHEQLDRKQAYARALALFQKVRIPSPERRLDAYPHEMSGGMRQRAMIALALACNPEILLADEPTTALDATVQIQILLLLRELQRELGLSIIFVTHDIGAATEVADRMAVMYAGRIVEQGPTAEILSRPSHPYTQALMQSRGHGVMRKGEPLPTIPGSPPDLGQLPAGCAFASRCAHQTEICHQRVPPVTALSSQHTAHCWQLVAHQPDATPATISA
ncbi:ABC transporter ATP-binding protein [Corticimicrobacter populi]|uniref:Dipeptide ABC transporter ATP-binding protein DppD n=1 Tax=Corticimicrobacter populi TaxID=2175229 RepID=A0A2V1JYA2_9BURK|nr:ABC transporter ATP-binding protein [Corticimicrobacter populi]PWF21484.1 dipeptide ABC transporter ATP-binding protein DppD [Corticimicrobacter populi]